MKCCLQSDPHNLSIPSYQVGLKASYKSAPITPLLGVEKTQLPMHKSIYRFLTAFITNRGPPCKMEC